MFDIRGLVRLMLTTAHSNHQIGRLTGRSATTVARYRQIILDHDFDAARLDQSTDADLVRLFRAGQSTQASNKVQPDWHGVALKVKAGHHLVDLHGLYEAEVGTDRAMSYRAFCRGHHAHAAVSHPIMIQRHHPGGAMMTDYAGYRPKGDDGMGGEAVFELFVAVLPASDYTFACVVRSQKTADWLEANERALRFFGGVPETIVSDNLKAAVSRPKGRAGPAVINPAFEAFCDHHGTLAKPAAVYSPTHKAKVEIGVKLVQRLLSLALKDRPLLRLGAMNAVLTELVERLNHKPLRRAEGETRYSLYETLDLPALRSLRQDAFAFHEVRRGLMLGSDYHLVHDQCRYSAPHTLIGRKLDLRANTHAVEIWHDGRAVALHARLFQPGGLSTDPAHMPPAHLARRAEVEEDFLLWARLQGAAVQAVAQAEADRPFYGAAKAGLYRAFRELHRRVGARRLEAACDRAVRSGRPRMDHVRNILNRGLEFTDPADFVTPDIIAETNENVRGADYFTGA